MGSGMEVRRHTAGLGCMVEWVKSTDHKASWMPAICRGARTTAASAEDRNLLGLVLHSAVRLGYRILSELRESVGVMTAVERDGHRH